MQRGDTSHSHSGAITLYIPQALHFPEHKAHTLFCFVYDWLTLLSLSRFVHDILSLVQIPILEEAFTTPPPHTLLPVVSELNLLFPRPHAKGLARGVGF